MLSGIFVKNFSISSSVDAVPVGLLGDAIKITLVFSWIASAMASRSCPQFFASTLIASAPLAFIAKGYMAKPCFE